MFCVFMIDSDCAVAFPTDLPVAWIFLEAGGRIRGSLM